MKRVYFTAVAVALVVLTAGGAFATTDVQVDVTASVTQKCDVTANGLLDITIDPTFVGNQSFGVTQPEAKCTKTRGITTAGVSASSAGSGLTSNSGSLVGRLTGGGLTPIPYTFTFDNTVVGNGFGAGALNVDFNIDGYVAEADAEAAEWGSFTDTVIMTLSY